MRIVHESPAMNELEALTQVLCTEAQSQTNGRARSRRHLPII